MKYIFLLVLSMLTNSMEVIERTDNTITLKSKTQNFKLLDTLISNDNLNEFQFYKWSTAGENYVFNNLESNTKYYLYTNEDDEPQIIFTLAKKPIYNHRQIIGFKADPGKIKIFTDKVEDSNTLIIAKMDEIPKNPDNGEEYNSKNGEILFFNGKFDDKVQSKKLDYGKYYIRIFSYNGEGQTTNYNTEESINNPRYFFPQLFPPVAVSVVGMEENVYRIKWDKVDGALYYELQVSDNKEFTTRLEEYDNADVGNGNIFDIYIEDTYDDTYWRIRAVGEGGRSDFSNVLKIEAKK